MTEYHSLRADSCRPPVPLASLGDTVSLGDEKVDGEDVGRNDVGAVMLIRM